MASPTLIPIGSAPISWPSECRSELVDLYCLGRLTPGATEAFEEHYLACPACAEQVATADEFIAALRTVTDPRQMA